MCGGQLSYYTYTMEGLRYYLDESCPAGDDRGADLQYFAKCLDFPQLQQATTFGRGL